MRRARLIPILAGLSAGLGLAAQEEGSRTADRAQPRIEASDSGRGVSIMSTGSESRSNFTSDFTVRPVITPREMERCTSMPTTQAWEARDLVRELRTLSRQGYVPVTMVKGGLDAFKAHTEIPSGWRAYGFVVPGKGELEVRLTHPNQGWFRLLMMNKWGQLSKGMLQNLHPKGDPIVTYKNPGNSAQAVFVLADDPGWMSSSRLPYTLNIKRSWSGKEVDLRPVPQRLGIWAMLEGQLEKATAAAPAKAETPRQGTGLP